MEERNMMSSYSVCGILFNMKRYQLKVIDPSIYYFTLDRIKSNDNKDNFVLFKRKPVFCITKIL